MEIDLLADFDEAMVKIIDKTLGTDSIYDKTLIKLSELYDTMGMTETAKASAIAEVSSNLAVSTTNAAISAAVELAKSKSIVESEVAYNDAKKTVTIESRIDNLVLEDLKGQLQYMSTVGAGGLTVDAADFEAANSLRSAIYYRAKGIALPDIVFGTASPYVVAT